MKPQAQFDFDIIAEAIDFIKNNYAQQPSLDDIAAHVNMSPSHFQKMFTEWAGVNTKTFLQYTSLKYAKLTLRKEQATLFNTADDIDLSNTSRLHDMFVKIEAMTPAEYKNEGEGLLIKYNYAITIFGKIIIAKTNKGICYMAFYQEEEYAFHLLKNYFPKANFAKENIAEVENILKGLTNNFDEMQEIKLHIKGTAFQIKVWESLLKIPFGNVTTYRDIATKAGNAKAARAAGTAIGDNPVTYLIPCHRVIQASGVFGGYMWGPKRKAAILGWEAAQLEKK